MEIKVTRYGRNPAEVMQEIRLEFSAVEGSIKFLGDQTRDKMREYVRGSLTRDGSTGNLERSIESYHIKHPDGLTVGIGSIEYMNFKAPYWYLMNYGGLNTAAARGLTLYGHYSGAQTSFVEPRAQFKGTSNPDGGVSKDQFVEGAPFFPMKPESPIAPKSFIQQTQFWLSRVVRVHFSGAHRKRQIL